MASLYLYKRLSGASTGLVSKHSIAMGISFVSKFTSPMKIMSNPDRLKEENLKRLQMFIYLVPIVGFFPALWTMYRGKGDRELRNVSRLTVTLAGGWLLGYVLLGVGAQTLDGLSLQLLILASLLTSGYFVVNIVLMVRLWQHKALRLPGVSQLGDRLP
jgi:hypothetical protein